MVEVTLKLHYKCKNYLTNVIVEKDMPKTQILQIARDKLKHNSQ